MSGLQCGRRALTVQAEIHREVVAGTRRYDDEGQAALRGNRGDKRLRTVSTGHPQQNRTVIHRASGDSRQVPAQGMVDQENLNSERMGSFHDPEPARVPSP